MQNEIDGMVYCYEIDKWVTKEEYKDFVAIQLQQKIAKSYKLLYKYELDKFLEELGEKNGTTLYF